MIKTFFVTGGAGFIGSHLVKFLINQGARVINIDVLTYAGCLHNLSGFLDHPQHHFFALDINNTQKISDLISEYRPDACFHLAAESHVDRSIDDATAFIKTNIVGTHALIDTFLQKRHHCQNDFRFIHVSTDEVFGALGYDDAPFHELSNIKPNSPYAASKAAGELLVRSYIKTHNFPALIANPANTYGPQQYPEKLIPLVILNALEKKPLPIFGNGKQRRDWLYVQDHILALWHLYTKGNIGEKYCISAVDEQQNIDVVEQICHYLSTREGKRFDYTSLISHVKDRPAHDIRYSTDNTKIKSLGWEPRTLFSDGLHKTCDFYCDNLLFYTQDADARDRRGQK